MYALDLSAVRWRKSSRSGGGSNDACVEVAFPEPTAVPWRKSSRSGGGSNNACLEVAFAGPAVAVRDSKVPDGAVLAFDQRAWSSFLASLR
ncbi:DUF397 domain-containing protein [Actinopolyspora sp. H202]|uniref:DUF397 domain-containing protein n=1 Tax=Actinopolyspora sp. H202 TaxID=1500456 RepID=UPI003EE6BE78